LDTSSPIRKKFLSLGSLLLLYGPRGLRPRPLLAAVAAVETLADKKEVSLHAFGPAVSP